MPAMTIPPWLVPPNYPAIMESAARVGSARSGQAASELEAAGRLNLAQEQEQNQVGEAGDRLRLAYAQLAAGEREAAQNMRARIAQQNAAMALRSQQQQSLDDYRNTMATIAADRLLRQNTPNPAFQPTSTTVAGQDLIQTGPNRWQFKPTPKPTPFKPNPADVADVDILKQGIIADNRALLSVPDEDKPAIQARIEANTKKLHDLASKLVAPAAAGVALTSGTGTTKGANGGGGYQSPESVREAYKAGTLTKDQAEAILKDQFGYQ